MSWQGGVVCERCRRLPFRQMRSGDQQHAMAFSRLGLDALEHRSEHRVYNRRFSTGVPGRVDESPRQDFWGTHHPHRAVRAHDGAPLARR